MKTLTVTRYVAPLHEGGSLPAIVETDDEGLYVLKFRGAGQGSKALIAELVAGEIAHALGLPMPDIAFVSLDPELARTEPDPEIQELIRASAGLNFAIDYLPGSVMFDPVVTQPGAALASDIVWFDAFISNVDRTANNTNMLVWHHELKLIDHGAALYFHHSWDDYLARSRAPFARVKDHVLLPFAAELASADVRMSARLTPDRIHAIIGSIPDDWLRETRPFASADENRRAYVDYLLARLEPPHAFIEEAIRARSLLV